jgi:hypothetical protein
MAIKELRNGPTVYPAPVIPQVIDPSAALTNDLGVRGLPFTDEYQ